MPVTGVAPVAGIRGLVVIDEQTVQRVFPILEPSNGYYATMTKSAWMPCLSPLLSRTVSGECGANA